MRTALFIARRYLFSRKRFNAVNILSIISAIAIGIVSLVMVCVLSIFNGYEELILSQNSRLSPDLRIIPAKGSFLKMDVQAIKEALKHPGIALRSGRLTAQGMILGQNGRQMVLLQGYGDKWEEMIALTDSIVEGELPSSSAQDTLADKASIGVGLRVASELGLGVGYTEPVTIYIPNRMGVINPLAPMTAFKSLDAEVAAVLNTGNDDDDGCIFMPLSTLQALLSYPENQVSGIDIRLRPGYSSESVLHDIQSALGTTYKVLDRTRQHPELSKLVMMEKWMSYLIMIFILLLAAFNIISSLSMLLIEKEHDVFTLRSLGASQQLINRIFMIEGMLISCLGSFVGIVLGILICQLQQHFGWVTYPIGMQTVPYPVRVKLTDTLIVVATTLFMSWLSAGYPVRYFGKRHFGTQKNS